MTTPKHSWQFVNAGGLTQVRLRNAADLMALAALDQKLWAALSCPTDGLELDPKTLQAIDLDGDGRVRAQELLAAVEWTGRMLKDPEVLTAGKDVLQLASINDADPEGKRLKASAIRILTSLGRKDAAAISAAETEDSKKIFADTRYNGDGVIPAEAAETAELQAAMADIIRAVGSVEDRSGRPGLNEELTRRFFADAELFVAWSRKGQDVPEIRPLGDATAAALDAVDAVRAKIDDYFLRCHFAAFDARFQLGVEKDASAFALLADGVLSITTPALEAIPLATPGVGRPLPLVEGLNPIWSARMQAFRTAALEPIVGARDTLTEAEWNTIVSTLAPHAAWRAEELGASVAALGVERASALLTDGTRAAIEAMLAEDMVVKQEADDVFLVDRLVRYHRDLFQLARNYVSFQDFYAQDPKAIFQAGTLYIDTRSCDLCIRVNNVAAHAASASLSQGYLAYCDLVRRATGEKMSIVAVVSNGDADHMLVGRNGIFYDRQNRDWDATIVKVIDNPMSLRQAFWSPYKKIAKLVEHQIEKFAATRDQEVEAQASTAVEEGAVKVTEAAPPAPGAKPTSFDVAKFAGIFAAIGLAIGAIGGALGAMLSAFSRLAWWQMPLAIMGLMLVVSGPALLLAWMKLRKRSLAPLLDANGWAVNSRIPISVGFGETLTHLASLPRGARVMRRDPYARPNHALHAVISVFLLTMLGVGGHYAWSNKLFPWQQAERADAAPAAAAPSDGTTPTQAAPAPE